MTLADWLPTRAVAIPGWQAPPESAGLAPLMTRLDKARVLFLGESNHFVQEKIEFRRFWLEQAARRRPLVIIEELGWHDGRQIARYLENPASGALESVSLFGSNIDRRSDRDDAPTGVFRSAFASYPHALMHAAHEPFLNRLRKLRVRGFYGFDVDAPGVGQTALEDSMAARSAVALQKRLARQAGESLEEEAERLDALIEAIPRLARSSTTGHDTATDQRTQSLLVEDLVALRDGLRYAALLNPAVDYAASRPAMAFREECMKRRVDWVLEHTPEEVLLVLLGHAFHLVKDDALTEERGVGPGGGEVASLGHYLTQERGLEPLSIWMLYGTGEDAQPLVDLPTRAEYPASTLNRQLLELMDAPVVLPVLDGPLAGEQAIGHMYNLVAPVQLARQADAVTFVPEVSPLGG